MQFPDVELQEIKSLQWNERLNAIVLEALREIRTQGFDADRDGLQEFMEGPVATQVNDLLVEAGLKVLEASNETELTALPEGGILYYYFQLVGFADIGYTYSNDTGFEWGDCDLAQPISIGEKPDKVRYRIISPDSHTSLLCEASSKIVNVECVNGNSNVFTLKNQTWFGVEFYSPGELLPCFGLYAILYSPTNSKVKAE